MIETVYVCDRCGVRSPLPSPQRPKAEPITVSVSVRGLACPIDVDLCAPCRAVLSAALFKALSLAPSGSLSLSA